MSRAASPPGLARVLSRDSSVTPDPPLRDAVRDIREQTRVQFAVLYFITIFSHP